MNAEIAMPSPTPDDVALLQQVQQFWNTGDQVSAIETLRAHSSDEKPWAAALLAWLFMQQGYPALEESVTWAATAARGGLTSQLLTTFNNVVANLPAYPQLSNRLPELFEFGLPWVSGVDQIGQGWNLASSGYTDLGLQLMMLPTYPVIEPHLSALVNQAKARVDQLDEIASDVRQRAEGLEVVATDARAAIDKARGDLETSAKQAGLLVTTTTSDATNALFKADAQRNTKESRTAWISGLWVLGAAATVAVLPVVLHYLHLSATYSPLEQIALHLVSTAALATFAGVLLACARSRDHAAQRAHDLSTAMGTMISYSNQITDLRNESAS